MLVTFSKYGYGKRSHSRNMKGCFGLNIPAAWASPCNITNTCWLPSPRCFREQQAAAGSLELGVSPYVCAAEILGEKSMP